MALLRDRLAVDGAAASVRSSGTTVAEIVGRIEAGATLENLAERGPLDAADLIAALAWSALGDDDSLGAGLVQGKPPRPRLAQSMSESALATLLPGAPLGATLALEAGLLQAHDFWDASHAAAQRADDLGERGVSAYWHGIAHRREPDAGNAAYWFRRVGRHPVFAPLATAVGPWLDQHGDPSLTESLIAARGWNVFAMIDLCSGARPGSAIETLARRLQRLEMWLLLEATFTPLATTARS